MSITNMMVNPLKREHLDKIKDINASYFTLNLEDAIAKSRKKEALNNIVQFLSKKSSINRKIIVRINPLDNGGVEEIKALNNLDFFAIRVAKVKSRSEIEKALKLIRDDKEIHISLETKEAFYNIQNLRVDKRFTTANLGILDLLNSFKLTQSILSIDNPTIEYILSKFLLDCQSVDILPVSFMYQDYKNIEEFEAWCKKEKLMGFRAKACLGPKQVEIANKIFMLKNRDINRAKEIVAFFEANSKNGENGVMHSEYGFIDEPIYKDALLTLKSIK